MAQMKVDLQKATENAAETFCGLTQKEGMGPLEYQTMPSLRDVRIAIEKAAEAFCGPHRKKAWVQ